MFKFFRRIRQQLLENGKLKRYLVYTTGEILLVMIGILLALQVNNWNERRKQTLDERIILKEIKDNLKVDLEDFQRNLIHFKNTQMAAQNLIHAIESGAENHDSLSYHLYYVGVFPHFTPNVSGYDLLQSRGLDIVSNDSLRQAITNLYEGAYIWIQTWEKERIAFTMANLTVFRNKYLGTTSLSKLSQPKSIVENSFLNRYIESGGIRKLIHYDKLRKDYELISTLKDAEVYAKLLNKLHLKVQDQVLELTSQIERDLN